MSKRFLCVCCAAALSLALAGCGDDSARKKRLQVQTPATIPVPAWRAGTLAEHALFSSSSGDIMVKAYGLVHNLGVSGSREVPSQLRKYFTDYLYNLNYGSARAGTAHMTPEMILADLDTTIVEVTGMSPMGAPVGSRFDVLVTALPVTTAKDLSGGSLMPVDLRVALRGQPAAGGQTSILGEAAGPVVVNPFLDMAKPEDRERAREARIIGGGLVRTSRPVRLRLIRPDYSRVLLIQAQINQRFAMTSGKAAIARNQEEIELTVPPEYRTRYKHFIDLVIHMPMTASTPEAIEKTCKEFIARMSRYPEGIEDLSLSLEALGKLALSEMRPAYSSEDAAVRFHVARAGLRLGDASALEPIRQLAAETGNPWQIPAIRELGQAGGHGLRQLDVLRNLLDSDSDLVRVAAYEALVALGDRHRIQRTLVGTGSQQFAVDVVTTEGRPLIYAAQSKDARIAMFGENLPIGRPMFFQMRDSMVVINATDADDKPTVVRRILATERFSAPFDIEPDALSLAKVLGDPPRAGHDMKIQGLGFNYGQVITVLAGMCEKGNIRARFILEPPPLIAKAYQGTTGTSRPD